MTRPKHQFPFHDVPWSPKELPIKQVEKVAVREDGKIMLDEYVVWKGLTIKKNHFRFIQDRLSYEEIERAAKTYYGVSFFQSLGWKYRGEPEGESPVGNGGETEGGGS